MRGQLLAQRLQKSRLSLGLAGQFASISLAAFWRKGLSDLGLGDVHVHKNAGSPTKYRLDGAPVHGSDFSPKWQHFGVMPACCCPSCCTRPQVHMPGPPRLFREVKGRASCVSLRFHSPGGSSRCEARSSSQSSFVQLPLSSLCKRMATADA